MEYLPNDAARTEPSRLLRKHEKEQQEDLSFFEPVRERIDEALPWLHPVSKKYQEDSTKLDDLMRAQMQEDRVVRLGKICYAGSETMTDVQLQKHIERLAARQLLRENNTKQAELPQRQTEGPTGLPEFDICGQDRMPHLAEVEKQYILHVFHFMNGNLTKAAHVLGIDRKTLRMKLRRWPSLKQ